MLNKVLVQVEFTLIFGIIMLCSICCILLYYKGDFFFLVFSRAAPAAYGCSQARGLIGAVAARLHQSHSHSNARSRLSLGPTPELKGMPDP